MHAAYDSRLPLLCLEWWKLDKIFEDSDILANLNVNHKLTNATHHHGILNATIMILVFLSSTKDITYIWII